MDSPAKTHDVAVVGAGPIGIELAVNLQAAGLDVLHLEAGQVGQTIYHYPHQTRFFSSAERIAICGIPLITPDQTKPTREQYLAYLRGVVQQFGLHVNTYERLTDVRRHPDGFDLETMRHGQQRCRYRVQRLVLTIGDMHRPRLLGIEGEDLPHVSHYFRDPHPYFGQDLLIVGGKNSAVEAALRCHHAGARVAISYRRDAFDEKAVKYWLRPELLWLIDKGDIAFHPETVPQRISPDRVVLEPIADAEPYEIPAQFVLLLTGYVQDGTPFDLAGVERFGDNQAPRLDPDTMQTDVPGLYVAGTAAAGSQQRFRLFIENSHPHVVRILRHLAETDPRHINELGFTRLHEHPEQPARPLET